MANPMNMSPKRFEDTCSRFATTHAGATGLCALMALCAVGVSLFLQPPVMAATEGSDEAGEDRALASDTTDATNESIDAAETPASWFLIVSGIGGEQHYSLRFRRWSQSFTELVSQYRFVEETHVHRLAESVSDDGNAPPQPDDSAHEQAQPVEEETETPAQATAATASRQSLVDVDDESTLANIQSRLETIAAQAADGDTVFIVFIGHGSSDGGRALFNIPGPDLSSQDLREWLAAFKDQTVVLINTTSSSSPFLQTLADTGRIVITATSNPAENQHTYFGQYFIQAFAGDAADADKDRRISLLEAFSFATRETERYYEEKGCIATEHALLDDDGDGIGSTAPTVSPVDGDNLDGKLAATTFLHAGPKTDERMTEKSLSYDIAARGLVDEIESLKRTRNQLSEQDYDSQLEKLLVMLAQNRRDLRTELESATSE